MAALGQGESVLACTQYPCAPSSRFLGWEDAATQKRHTLTLSEPFLRDKVRVGHAHQAVDVFRRHCTRGTR